MASVCPLPAGGVLESFRAALDIEQVSAWVERYLMVDGAELRQCEPVYVRYKNGNGSLVGWKLTLHEGEQSHQTFLTVRSAPLGRLRNEAARLTDRRSEVSHGLRSWELLEDEQVLLLSFPTDRAIRALRGALRPTRVGRLATQAKPDLVADGRRYSKRRSRVRVVRYKPERRAVLAWDLVLVHETERPHRTYPLYLRTYAEPTARRAAAGLQSAAAAGVRCPRLIAMPHERMILETALAGTTPAEMDERIAATAGRALSTLHGAEPAESIPTSAPLGELDAVLRTCHDLDRLDVELGALAREVADVLSSWVPPLQRRCLLHGDMHRGQLVFDGEVCGLVDFDRVTVGSAARDLADVYAHELHAGADAARRVVAAVEHGYAERAPLPEGRERAWYRACATLRYAITPFRTLAADWPVRVRSLLGHARDVVAEVSG